MVRSAKIDPKTGLLVENPPMETSWQGIEDLLISPDGKHLYATSGYITGGQIYCWDVDETSGALSNQRTYSSLHTISWASGMAINPVQTLLYVVDYTATATTGAILIYNIDATTGNLTYHSSLTTPQYPMGVAFSKNTNRLVVSCQQSTSAPVQTIGIASYQLDALGIPTASLPWTSTLATTSQLWRNVLSVPAKGSSTEDSVFALESGGSLRGFANDQYLNYNSYSAGASAWDETIVTPPSGDSYLYTANWSANIISYKVDTTPGSLSGRVDTGKGGGSSAVRGIFLPW